MPPRFFFIFPPILRELLHLGEVYKQHLLSSHYIPFERRFRFCKVVGRRGAVPASHLMTFLNRAATFADYTPYSSHIRSRIMIDFCSVLKQQ